MQDTADALAIKRPTIWNNLVCVYIYIYIYIYRLIYQNFRINANQNSTIDTQITKRNPNTALSSNHNRREQGKKKDQQKENQNNE